MCDYKGTFMDVECRSPVSVNNNKVFTSFSINKMLSNWEMPATLQTIITSFKKVHNYLIGEPAYTHATFCMKEFDNCKNDKKVIFKNMFRLARNQIESSFRCLKKRTTAGKTIT